MKKRVLAVAMLTVMLASSMVSQAASETPGMAVAGVESETTSRDGAELTTEAETTFDGMGEELPVETAEAEGSGDSVAEEAGELTETDAAVADEVSVGEGIEVGGNDTDGVSAQTEDPQGEASGGTESGDGQSGAAADSGPAAEDQGRRTMAATGITTGGWQLALTFPRWLEGAIDDTLIVNDTCSFKFYKGQGYLEIRLNSKLKSFDLFINNKKVTTPKASCKLDISKFTVDGRNTIRVSNIQPLDLSNAVQVKIPYPTVLEKKSTPAKAGLDADAFKFIDQIIKADVAHGYPGAQLAVVKGGQLIYNNAWGYVNRYNTDGEESDFLDKTTTETLYDLSGLSTLYTLAAVEHLVSMREISLDSKVVDILGEEFVENTVEMDFYPEKPYNTGGVIPSLETIKEWKRQITIDQLLRYQSGLPGTGYYHRDVYQGVLHGEQANPLYVADGRKATTYEMICKTPLVAEPGTVYAPGDVDYILLGFIVEKVTGVSLDSYVKSVILDPMGLSHTVYNPTKNGFAANDCATTEISGNSRGGLVSFPGVRKNVVQGQVHDELAYYTMEGVAGHAGVFANAEDLAKFGSLFINGGYGKQRIIDQAVLAVTQAPNAKLMDGAVAGWRRRGVDGSYDTACLAGASAGPNVLCLSGFTRCMLVVDPDNQMVIAYCSNAIGTPITFLDPRTTTPTLGYARFAGNYYTSATMGFTSEIIYEGLKPASTGPSASYKSAMRGMLLDKAGLVAGREEAARRLHGTADEGSLLTAEDSIVQAYYALYEVANARIGKGEAKKIAREYLDAERDAAFLKKVYGIK